MVVEKSGNLLGEGKRFAVVVGRFNEIVTKNLLGGAIDCLTRHGVNNDDIDVYWVPGSFELPQVARKASKSNVSAVICLGALIRGDTYHFDILANQVVRDLSSLAAQSDVPVTFGVITADNQEQAFERAGSKAGNRGWTAALSALELADLWGKI
ncbi:MAG: 6,7-dimethyl-8-ribityllumazine synthase [Candidatus Latescibacteria bacterium 4484_7]|nr:MAG: 6,7-dimethyl-8-ribityllumazine synthase [Candidatus Latescibacteria bacterium 4484_7]